LNTEGHYYDLETNVNFKVAFRKENSFLQMNANKDYNKQKT